MEQIEISVGEKTYQRIRADVIFGRLTPGQKLRLDGLKEVYGVSVSTLRELFNRLSSEGLILAEGQKGFQVAPISAQDFRDVAAMRQLLECHALELSFAAGDMEWEGRVVSAHHKLALMEKRMLAGERSVAEQWKHYDREFHRALISACGSDVLLETHAGLYDKYLRYQMVAVVFRGEVAAVEHHKLLECALARDIGAAQQTLVNHIRDCVEDTLGRGLVT